ncbi:hypothetical protein KGQ72_02180 [Patescibacteria group bacterium]|nr:hypothetical protein [Patescibacteria group bacterium]
MRHEVSDIGHGSEIRKIQTKGNDKLPEDFVLEKSIFNNIFEKDIRRVFIYKKAERLAKAMHLIAPAFAGSVSLKNRVDAIAIGLVDAAILPPLASRTALAHELLSLSSVLSIARTGGLLSVMNVELITREAHILLQEVAAYEEPRLFLDDAPTLSSIAKKAHVQEAMPNTSSREPKPAPQKARAAYKGHIKDILDTHIKDRRESILSVIRNKGRASIKDISTLIRDVSEKTIQRELSALIGAGAVHKEGERRWSTYSLA